MSVPVSIENVPMFKVDYDKKITYFNKSAMPYLSYWKCLEQNKIPVQISKQHPEMFDRKLKTDFYEVDLKYQNRMIHFTVIPFPEAGWIGFYGEPMNKNSA